MVFKILFQTELNSITFFEKMRVICQRSMTCPSAFDIHLLRRSYIISGFSSCTFMYVKACVESFEESKFVFYKHFSAHVLSAVSHVDVGPLEFMRLAF